MPHQRLLGLSIYVFHRFFCECCHAIILIFLLSNFTLKFYLKKSAATRGISPNYLPLQNLAPTLIHLQA